MYVGDTYSLIAYIQKYVYARRGCLRTYSITTKVHFQTASSVNFFNSLYHTILLLLLPTYHVGYRTVLYRPVSPPPTPSLHILCCCVPTLHVLWFRFDSHSNPFVLPHCLLAWSILPFLPFPYCIIAYNHVLLHYVPFHPGIIRCLTSHSIAYHQVVTHSVTFRPDQIHRLL